MDGCRSGQRLFIETVHLVGVPVTISDASCTEPVAAAVYPRAGLRGTISGIEPAALPRSVELIVRPCSTPSSQWRSEGQVTGTGD